jgi:bifunctional enzyme CysN/CysC
MNPVADVSLPLTDPAGGSTAIPGDLLRLITCGSVDDGKSTLIGRLLFDTDSLTEDQRLRLARDSARLGAPEGELDYSLLLDGLEAEREQRITIDVAYRFLATPRRKFIIADCPGHEQYTRNMVTGASMANAAVVLCDARYGVLTQTRRHAFIVALMGIRHVVLAVNKMDLVDFDADCFHAIASEFRRHAEQIELPHVTAIPLSARFGDNVFHRSARTPFYTGPTLLEYLESVPSSPVSVSSPFRLPVQWVARVGSDFRGYAGTIASGAVRPGMKVVNVHSGATSMVRRLVEMGREREEAVAGEAVMIELASEIDIARGDVLADAEAPPELADQFSAHVVWLHEQPMYAGRAYLFKFGAATVPGMITEIRYQIDVNTLAHVATRALHQNEVAEVHIALSRRIPFEPYAVNRFLGSCIIIDRLTNATVGAGMMNFALRRSANLHWQKLVVDKTARSALKGQRPAVIWFTGLSGSGKSTIANLVEQKLHAEGRHTYILDGDNIRHGLSRDLGFTEADRVENIRRVAEAAKLFVDAGLIVLVSFISPYRADRDAARSLVGADEFIEVFVDTPPEECERRDPKGLYRKARAGLLKNFTGVDAPYEPPEAPELTLQTLQTPAEELAEQVVSFLRSRGYLG